MKIEKTFNVKMTPDEVKSILAAHLKKTHNLDVKKVNFSITKVYEGSHDSYGSDELTSISCSGDL